MRLSVGLCGCLKCCCVHINSIAQVNIFQWRMRKIKVDNMLLRFSIVAHGVKTTKNAHHGHDANLMITGRRIQTTPSAVPSSFHVALLFK